MTIWMQDRSVEIIGDSADIFAEAYTLAVQYLPLLSGPKQSSDTSNTTAEMKAAKLHDLFSRCSVEFNRGKQIEAACAAAADYVPDPSVPDTHQQEFLAANASLDLLIHQHHARHEPNRFNIERLKAFRSDINPEDYRRLEIIATDGVHIPTPKDFKPAPPNPKPRTLTEQLGNTHAKHYLQAATKGDCLAIDPTFIPKEVVSECAFMDHNWVGKRDADGQPVPKGRVCIDPTNVEGGDPINSPDMAEHWKDMYGPIPYTTVIDFITAMLHHADENGFPLREGRIWKDDVSNAFGQMKFDIPSVKKSAIALRIPDAAHSAARATGKPLPYLLYLFMLYCYFGWGGASYAFGVFSRALQEIISKVIIGILMIYVDDLMGFAHHSKAATDQAIAQRQLRAFFGANAVAAKSITPCIAADILGWFIDLSAETIRPSDRGCRKLLWAFFLVPMRPTRGKTLKWQLPLCQLIASLANRYSLAIRGLNMFVQPLNDLLRGDSKADRNATSSARFCVEVWRAVACILALSPEDLALPLRHLIPTVDTIASFGLVTDAGPNCIGLALFRTDSNNHADMDQCILFTDFPIIGWNENLATEDPRYQNTREYCGAVLGLILVLDAQAAGLLPPGPIHLHWHGDNTAALSWIEKNRMQSAQTQQIFMVYTWLRLRTPHDIPWCSHIPGIMMGDIDRLSRQQLLQSLDPSLRFEFRNRKALEALFRLIDPSAPPTTVADHHAAFMNIHHHITPLLS